MTRARLLTARGSIAKIAVAGVLMGIATAAVSIPAYAAPAGTPSVLFAPLPAEPPPPEPPAPPPTHGHHAETEDWWGYGMDAGGGGGGGG